MKLRPILKNKSGKGNGALWTIAVVVGILAILVAGGIFIGGKQSTIGGVTTPPSNVVPSICPSDNLCPTDLAWAGTANMQNKANTTGVETYDTTTYFFDKDSGTLKTSITDTSSGAVTLTCGRSYVVKTASTAGEAGDSARLIDTDIGSVNSNGEVEFTACGDGETFTIGSNQHGLWEIRAFDVINNGFAFNYSTSTGTSPSGLTATSYIAGDQVYGSSTNATNISVGSGGEAHWIAYIRPSGTDTNLNDMGTLVLVDAASSEWNEPNVFIDGVKQSNVKNSALDANEIKAYADYEYVYLIPASRSITRSNELKFDFSVFAASGNDPTSADSIPIVFAPRGKTTSTQTNNLILTSAVQDDSSLTRIHTNQTLRFAVQ